MDKKHFILGMTFASFCGAIIAIIITSLLTPSQRIYQPANGADNTLLTNYNFDSADFIVPEGLNFIYASKVATPAVVHIRTTFKSYAGRKGRSDSFDQFFRDYFGEERGEGSPGGGQARGTGSGVIITEDGYIATNNHVVEDASEIKVVLGDNRTYVAEVIGTDPSTDLALLKIDETSLPTLPYGNSDKSQVGEWVLAVGNPFEFRSTVTAGIVSAKGRNINILRRNNGLQIESFIQTDAAVNPGNSGGALVNLKGELIGINTAIATQTGSYSGYSFAVPSNLVKKVINDLKEFGTVQRALLGISILDVTAELAEKEDLTVLKGIYVNAVNENSAADEAGIRSGDVIVAIEGKKVNSVAELQETVAINSPGDEISVTYIRDGNRKITRAELKSFRGDARVTFASATMENDGAEFSDVSREELARLDISGGVKVEKLTEGKWKDAGIPENFIITEIDKRPVDNIRDLQEIIRRYSDAEGVLIEGVNQEGKIKYFGIDL